MLWRTRGCVNVGINSILFCFEIAAVFIMTTFRKASIVPAGLVKFNGNFQMYRSIFPTFICDEMCRIYTK